MAGVEGQPAGTNRPLRPGDSVVVLPLADVLSTLDERNALDGVPFMPEMQRFCGRSFRVSHQVLQAVFDAAFVKGFDGAHVRQFRGGRVYVLEDTRCTGSDHDNCSRGCRLYWKEAWLGRSTMPTAPRIGPAYEAPERVELPVRTQEGRYYCQSSEFLSATLSISVRARFAKAVKSVWLGNYRLTEMFRMISTWS